MFLRPGVVTDVCVADLRKLYTSLSDKMLALGKDWVSHRVRWFGAKTLPELDSYITTKHLAMAIGIKDGTVISPRECQVCIIRMTERGRGNDKVIAFENKKEEGERFTTTCCTVVGASCYLTFEGKVNRGEVFVQEGTDLMTHIVGSDGLKISYHQNDAYVPPTSRDSRQQRFGHDVPFIVVFRFVY